MNENVLKLYRQIEDYDPSIARHSKDVADHVKDFMSKMGFSKEDANIGYEAGLVHDAGKLLIPSEIISKPGVLTVMEKNIMEEHSKRADEVMKDLPQIYQIVAIHHHDNFSAANRRMADRLTPIISVCDVYSALTLDRSYKNKLTPMDAITVMTDDISVLDPQCLKQFKDYLRDVGELYRSLPKEYEPKEKNDFEIASIAYISGKYGLNPGFITVDDFKGWELLVYDKKCVLAVLDNGMIAEEPHEVEMLSNDRLYDYDKEWTDKDGLPLEDILDEEIQDYEDFLSELDL